MPGKKHRILERLEPRVLLAGDLVAHWRAHELAESLQGVQEIEVWSDLVNEIPAQAFGTPQIESGDFGGRPSVRFDEATGKDWFQIDKSVSPLTDAQDFSVAVAFSTDDTSLQGNTTDWFDGLGIVHANQRGFNADWGISINASGRVAVGLGRGLFQPSNSLFSNASDLNDNQRHVALFTRQADTMSLYIDDQPVQSAAGADQAARKALNMFFGINEESQLRFIGNLAEVRVYDGALDQTESQNLISQIDSFYNNSIPNAVADQYIVSEDKVLFALPRDGVLANDTDVDGDELTAQIVDRPRHGELGFSEDGSFVYSPQDDFFGIDTFTYTANDFRPSPPAVVTIQVTPTYDPPIGKSDVYKGFPTAKLLVDAAAGLLSNDTNIDEAELTTVLADDVSTGQLDLSSDGSFEYDPQNHAGSVTFSYRIDDKVNLSDPVTVHLIINTPPIAKPDHFTLNEDSLLTLPAATGVVANDVDADGDALTASLVEGPQNGELAFKADGSLVYRPHEDFFGSDSFSYTLSDGVDESGIAQAQLTIQPVNDAPNVQGEAYFVSRNGQLNIDATKGTLANDSDIENNGLTVSLVSPPTHGVLQLRADGSFEYQPHQDFQGMDQFTYEVKDGDNATATAITELFVDAAPIRISEFMAANQSTLVTRTRAEIGGRYGEDILTPDWIELENQTDGFLDISGFYLTDDQDNLTKWQIPANTILEKNDFLVILASGLDIHQTARDELGLLHTNFKLGDEAGEYLAVVSPTETVLFEFAEELPRQHPDYSFGLSEFDASYLSEPTPGGPNATPLEGVVAGVVASAERGFYDAPFEVSLQTTTPDAKIYYTLNGSIPTPDDGILYQAPISIDTTSNLRAVALKDDHVPSRVQTQTYLFINDILQQPSDPEGFPNRWGGASAADYAMDPRVVSEVDSGFYDAHVAEGLKALPSISITMNVDEFFGSRGIQSNPQAKGDRWERASSIEFIDFPHFEDTQVNSGIRMVGNASRNPNRYKHNMRLVFRDDYGNSSLQLPLFQIGEGEEHQNLILRGGNGDSWINPGTAKRAQYIRDQWQRDSQIAMGNLTTQQAYSHLYINGLYWGLYHVFERHDASFMALHLGGDEEDYEAIKDVNGNNAQVEAVSGDTAAWTELFDIVDDRDMEDAEKYQEVEKRVDIDNMIDYLLLNFYAGNGDWDHNNFRAGRRIDGRFMFFSWDAERADINRSNDTSGGPLNVTQSQIRINVVTKNSPGRTTRIHQQLRRYPEYQLRFADRMQKHFFNGGVLSPEGASALWNARADEIRLPLAAESARWGDRHSSSGPKTVANWQEVLDVMNNDFFPVRTDLVYEQLDRQGLTFDLQAPVFSQHGGDIAKGFELSMAADEGTIFYTIDGNDPRIFGGDLSETAVEYQDAIILGKDTLVNARVLLDGQWSPLTEARFEVAAISAGVDSIRISEIHFNPADPSEVEIAAGFDNNDDFEFIELVNISSETIDVSNARFELAGDEGIVFDFANGNIQRLEPGGRLVVVEDASAFAFRYGDDLPVAGQWSGRLSNAGETLTLKVGDQTIHQFAYDDAWYPLTDGGGSSLEIIDPNQTELADWAVAKSWRASGTGGTPGQDGDPSPVPGDSNHDGVFNTTDLVLVFQAGKYEDGIANNATFEEGDWNGDGEFDTRDLVFVFQAGTFADEAIPIHPIMDEWTGELDDSLLNLLAADHLSAGLQK